MTVKDVLDFIKKHDLAVVSTADSNGKPQSAVVEFAELDDLSIIIDTFTNSKKYKNLQTNNKVAIVIGWDDNKTVQIDAVAKELSGGELEEVKRVYFKKNERAKEWENKPGIAYFAFKPSWVRYSDLTKHPWVVEEFNL